MPVNLFEFDRVGYRYSDGTEAIGEINFTCRAGENLAILGANGSGKSTLLRLINGLIHPTSGTIRFQGRELTEASLKQPDFHQEFRQKVGFVFQNADAQLFNPTTREEIAFGPRQLGLAEPEVQARTSDVLSFLGIEHLAERPPFRLSGGEKRKVAIASVLSMNPEVLILDEPFLGLDPRSQSWLIRTLNQLQSAGKTTIVATHSMPTVERVASMALVLDEDHALAALGPVSEILSDESLLFRTNLVERTP